MKPILMKAMIVGSLLFPSLLMAAQKSAGEGVPHFSLDHRIPLTGGEGWDYLTVDSSNERLFVTRGNHVEVVDLKSEKVVGQINAPIDGAHGVVTVPTLNKGYITSGKSAKVIAFDLTTLKVLKEIPAGKKADAVVFEPSTFRVFSFNGEDKTFTVIDAKTDSVVKTVALSGKPEFAVTDDGMIYVNDEDRAAILVIDAKDMSIKNTWPLTGCRSPSGLSADFAHHRLFSVCENRVMVVTDIASGALVNTLPIGDGSDAAGFDDGLVFSSNGEGTLTVIQERNGKTFKVLENVATQKGARTMAVDHTTHAIYLITAKYEPADPKAAKVGGRPKIIPGTVELLVMKKQL